MAEPLDEYLESLLTLAADHRLAELYIEGPDFKVKLKTEHDVPEVDLAQFSALPGPLSRLALPEQGYLRHEPISDHLHDIRSPLVGVFYRSSSPETPSFVEPGDYVRSGQVVCLIEAMKVFNEICADRNGRVVAICSQEGQIVEQDQVLIRLDPRAHAPEE
jgi:acetyl-CoA carboxylase biotin carboxyl carrier protein